MTETVTSTQWARRPRIFDHPDSGHYESWFVRANAPDSRQAFWIRYTLFVPAADPRARLAEIWAIWFDGAKDRVCAAQEDIPWNRCHLDPDRLDLDFQGSTLTPGRVKGQVQGKQHSLSWELEYTQGQGPLLLLPESRYTGGFPKAKSLVTVPMARFSGELMVDGERVVIEDWIGSENHNWGSRHTDAYAWGQVCGFDNEAGAFLECASARLKFGPVWTPPLSLAVLRLRGDTLRFNQLTRAPRNRSRYDFSHWDMALSNGRDRLRLQMESRPTDTAALYYKNPPGGGKTCLNSKLASCHLVLERSGQSALELHSESGAAFEILTDSPPLGTTHAN